MTAFVTIAAYTIRGLLGRRRVVLMVLLACVPVAVALLARLGGGRINEVAILDALVVRSILPLTALVLGTAALGSELDDGTAVYLLVKPTRRWLIVAAKAAVAAGLTAALAGASTILTGLVLPARSGTDQATIPMTIAVIVGGAVYTMAFVAASTVTSRALVLGLAYTLIWEGVLAGVLEGTRILSIREATLSIASALAPAGLIAPPLAIGGAVALCVVVLIGGFGIASMRLAAYEVHGTD